MEVTEAVILAGGKGTRLRSVTEDKIPKGLTLIQEKPILEWEIDWLAREGVDHVVLAVGHLASEIRDHFDGEYQSRFGNVRIDISEEKEKLGSGGGFKLATNLLDTEQTYVLNGDILTNVALQNMKNIHERNDALATMLLVNMVSPYGIIKRKNQMIQKFVEKPKLDVQIHAGIDIIERSIFDRFPDKGQMEETIFVELAEERKFASYLMSDDDYWKSVDTAKDFKNANKNWPGF